MLSKAKERRPVDLPEYCMDGSSGLGHLLSCSAPFSPLLAVQCYSLYRDLRLVYVTRLFIIGATSMTLQISMSHQTRRMTGTRAGAGFSWAAWPQASWLPPVLWDGG